MKNLLIIWALSLYSVSFLVPHPGFFLTSQKTTVNPLRKKIMYQKNAKLLNQLRHAPGFRRARKNACPRAKLEHIFLTKFRLSKALVIVSYDPDDGAKQCTQEASITKKVLLLQ